MASPGTLRVGRYFLALLAIFAVLYGLIAVPGWKKTPKLGLDLEGGAQVIYQAKTPNGQVPSRESMNEARDIIEQRVNGLGVAQAEVVIQGSDEIVVSVPGVRSDSLASLGNAAKLDFRPVVIPPVPVGAAAQAQAQAVPTASGAASGSPAATTSPGASGAVAPSGSLAVSGSGAPAVSPGSTGAPASGAGSAGQSPKGFADRPLAAPTSVPTSAAATAPSGAPASVAGSASSAAPSSAAPSSVVPSGTAGASAAAPAKGTNPDPLKNLGFPVPTTYDAYSKLTDAQKSALQTAMSSYDCSSQTAWPANQSILACDSKTDPSYVFLLGPVIVPGSDIAGAQPIAPNLSGNGGSAQWTVSLDLKSAGQKSWADYTTANHSDTGGNIPPVTSCGTGTPCAEYVAFVLDNVAISVPHNEAAINGTSTQISGGFTQDSATKLANELKYGALPLSFSTLTSGTVTATLGSAQLKAGLIAGGIGLVLVVLYSLMYYRALGLVTIASLLVSGGLTYASLVILGREIGFTLTLAGIAGFIVAIGITADSFVVFFERIKDEVHGGRSTRTAVPRAWVRARRTILSADTVSFLAAAVLYIFAAGDVKGFAFTLGLSTILDLVVVFLFTHPLVSLLSRSRAFASAKFTGLHAARSSVADAAPAASRGGSAERARTRRAAADRKADRASAQERGSAVAVLDRDELSDDDPDRQDAPPSSDPPAANLGSSRGSGASTTAHRPAEPGSAAERAAARRARLRAEKDGR